MIEIAAETDGNRLRRKGAEQSPCDGSVVAILATDVESWEEYTPAPYTTAEYEAEVERRIRERYSVSQELAILRQRQAKPEEFAAYDAYAETCKAEARAALTPEETDEPLKL